MTCLSTSETCQRQGQLGLFANPATLNTAVGGESVSSPPPSSQHRLFAVYPVLLFCRHSCVTASSGCLCICRTPVQCNFCVLALCEWQACCTNRLDSNAQGSVLAKHKICLTRLSLPWRGSNMVTMPILCPCVFSH